MRHSPPGPVLPALAIKALEQDPLPLPDPAPIVPLHPVRLPHRGRLPRAVRVPVLDPDHGVVGHGARVRERERVLLHGAVDGAPDVDDAVAAAEQLVGLFGEVVEDARAGGLVRLVDVHAGDGGAGGARPGPADGVVEQEDTLGARLLEEQPLDFRVVDALDLGVGVEGSAGGGGGDVAEGAEGVPVEREVCLAATDIVDLDRILGIREVALRDARGGFLDVVKRFRAVARRLIEVQGSGDWSAGNVGRVVGGSKGLRSSRSRSSRRRRRRRRRHSWSCPTLLYPIPCVYVAEILKNP